MSTVKEILDDVENRMGHTLDALHRELTHLRAGRAHTGLVDHIRVPAYSTEMPLNQLATISTPDARTILVSPYDKSLAGAVEKAINQSDIGLMANSDGSLIRLLVPELTEERRRDLLKVVNKQGEDARVALRNVRRDANEHIKRLEKNKEISEDELHHQLEQVDKMLEKRLAELDRVLAAKQKEITEF
jgi:ribosome recycling factor